MLAYAELSKPYELHVDGSRDGIGGVLYQESEGRLRPVAYVSRSLTLPEKLCCTQVGILGSQVGCSE